MMFRTTTLLLVLLATLTLKCQGQSHTRVKRMQPMPGYGAMVKKMQTMSMMMPDPKVGEMVASMSPADGNPEEMGTYYESDMLVPMGRSDVKMAEKFQFRWSNGVVPYEFNGDFSAEHKALILAAMDMFPKFTCVRFAPRNGEKDYISIENRPTGCWSALGRIGNKQPLNLQAPGCTTLIGTAMHEMMHALGIFHEQSRGDRDRFVLVRWENIIRGKEHNFEQHAKYYGFGLPYDYESVMHYSLKAFTKNQERTLDPSTQIGVQSTPKIGQRTGFSKADIEKINNLYGCNENSANEIDTKLKPPTPSPDFERPRPNYGKPDLERPNFGRPDFERPNYGRPDFERPNYGRPDFERPNYGRPDFVRPSYGKPDIKTSYVYISPSLEKPEPNFERPNYGPDKTISIHSFAKSFASSQGRESDKVDSNTTPRNREENVTKQTFETTTKRKKFWGIFK